MVASSMLAAGIYAFGLISHIDIFVIADRAYTPEKVALLFLGIALICYAILPIPFSTSK